MGWFILLFLTRSVFSANILFVCQVASPSHFLWHKELAAGLVNKGHNVTILSHYQEKSNSSLNYSLILLEGLYENSNYDIDLDAVRNLSPFKFVIEYYEWSYYICAYDLKTNGLKTLMNYPINFKFDLIIFDITVGYCLYPIIQRFHNPPTVGITPVPLSYTQIYTFGNTLSTSYMPYYITDFSDKMTLMERLLNFIYTYTDILYRKYYALPREKKLAESYFGNLTIPFEEVERNISLVMVNSDPISSYSYNTPPNIIRIGGLLAKPAQPLPQELKTVFDRNKNGVILFSLGSNVKSNQLSLEKRNAIMNAFAKVPQTVIWKFDTENIPNLPKNVIIRKWLPQNDILGYFNTKLFISHSGGLSIQEAIYHGVPLIGIPFFGDHYGNSVVITRKNIGKLLDYDTLMTENLYEAINETLSNPIYRNNIQKLSKKYKDQPQTPLERGLFWLEYILRHGSAEELVPASKHMPFYKLANLDILMIFIFVPIFIYFAIIIIVAVCKFKYYQYFNQNILQSKKKTM